MNKKKPLVSIVTSSWNRKKHLEKLAISLKNQTFKNFEWIVGNDGSIDNTDAFIRSFSKKNKFKIIYIKSNLRIGKSKLVNLMMKKVSGKFFIECDSDDYFLSSSLKDLLDLRKNLPKKYDKNFGGVWAQNVDTLGESQTFKRKEIKKNKILNWNMLKNKIDGDATILALSKNFKDKSYPEVDFLITESSLLEKIYKKKIFILSPQIVKVMDRKAKNSVSFGDTLSYTRGSFYTLVINETEKEFSKKKIKLKIITVLNYFRYSLHGDISLNKTLKKFKPFKKYYIYKLLFPFSLLFYIRDICFKKIEKTHIEFEKNKKKAKIAVEIFN